MGVEEEKGRQEQRRVAWHICWQQQCLSTGMSKTKLKMPVFRHTSCTLHRYMRCLEHVTYKVVEKVDPVPSQNANGEERVKETQEDGKEEVEGE